MPRQQRAYSGKRGRLADEPELDDYYVNFLSPLVGLVGGGVGAFIACCQFFYPSLTGLPVWFGVLWLLSFLAVGVVCSRPPLLRLIWKVGPRTIISLQPLRGAAPIGTTLANGAFLEVRALGPLVIVKRASGERVLWPRWLYRKWRFYGWTLTASYLSLARVSSRA